MPPMMSWSRAWSWAARSSSRSGRTWRATARSIVARSAGALGAPADWERDTGRGSEWIGGSVLRFALAAVELRSTGSGRAGKPAGQLGGGDAPLGPVSVPAVGDDQVVHLGLGQVAETAVRPWSQLGEHMALGVFHLDRRALGLGATGEIGGALDACAVGEGEDLELMGGGWQGGQGQRDQQERADREAYPSGRGRSADGQAWGASA